MKTSKTVLTPSTTFILPGYTKAQTEGWFAQWDWEKLVKYTYGIQWKKGIKKYKSFILPRSSFPDELEAVVKWTLAG